MFAVDNLLWRLSAVDLRVGNHTLIHPSAWGHWQISKQYLIEDILTAPVNNA